MFFLPLLALTFLATLPENTNAAGIQLPLYRPLQAENITSSSSARLKKARRQHLVKVEKNGQTKWQLKKSVQFDYMDEYYVVQVTVGTPAQTFNLTLDTNVNIATLFDKTFTDRPCGNYSQGNRRRFDSQASTTFAGEESGWQLGISGYAVNVNSQCNNDSDPSKGYAMVVNGYDTFGIGSGFVGFEAAAHFSLLTQFNGTLDSDWQSDGILGINVNVDDWDTSTIQEIAAKVEHPAVSLSFNHLADGSSQKAGYITIGDKDKKNCNDDWVYFDAATENFASPRWNIPLISVDFGNLEEDNVTIGSGYSNKDYLTMSLDATTTYLTLDPDFRVKIANQINAELDSETGLYLVKCSDVPNLPDIIYTLNATNDTPFVYRVPATDYARNLITRNDDKCTLLIQGESFSEEVGDQPWFTLVTTGTTAARSHCWYLQFDTGRMGIATSKTLLGS
jgi:hypothetical protein